MDGIRKRNHPEQGNLNSKKDKYGIMHSYVDISSQGNDNQSMICRHSEVCYKGKDWGDTWISLGGSTE